MGLGQHSSWLGMLVGGVLIMSKAGHSDQGLFELFKLIHLDLRRDHQTTIK